MLIKTLIIVVNEQVHIIPKVKLKDRIFHIIFQINDLENNRLRMSPNNAKLTDHLIPVLSQFIQTVSMYVIHDAESSRSMHISATSNQKLYNIMYSKLCPWLVQGIDYTAESLLIDYSMCIYIYTHPKDYESVIPGILELQLVPRPLI